MKSVLVYLGVLFISLSAQSYDDVLTVDFWEERTEVNEEAAVAAFLISGSVDELSNGANCDNPEEPEALYLGSGNLDFGSDLLDIDAHESLYFVKQTYNCGFGDDSVVAALVRVYHWLHKDKVIETRVEAFNGHTEPSFEFSTHNPLQAIYGNCVRRSNSKLIGIEEETTFEITAMCSQEEVEREVGEMLVYGKFELDAIETSESTFEKALEILSRDTTEQEGSLPFSKVKLQKIKAFYLSTASSNIVRVGEMLSNANGGSGVESLVILANKDETKFSVIQKTDWVE